MLPAPLPRPIGTRSGFALVIALSLMAFVLLLLVSITTFVRVESQSADIALAQLKARQNALLSLQIALGKLQAVAGPDQRSVARADLMARDARVNTSPNAVRKWWIGVSHSNGSSGIGAGEQAVRWLVSGLDTNRTAAQQLTDPLVEPVVLFGENSLDLDVLSGGEPLRAGRIFVDQGGRSGGAFAWLIDDESVKAKLRPADSAVDNAVPDAKLANQRHVLPGYFDLSSLSAGAELAAFTGTAATLARSTALAELQMQGVDAAVVKRRFFDYSLHGFGVLADSRNGGLKRDLTAAFERVTVFNDLFPDQSEPPYIAMDTNKFDSAAAVDLRDNGYIHFDIFRDFYNLKDYINNNELAPGFFEEREFFVGTPTVIHEGRRGPHQFSLAGHPYGEVATMTDFGDGQSSNYRHNPVNPVLGFMQQNAWLEYDEEADGSNPRFTTRAQLWAGVYNPYNINLRIDGRSEGPALIGYPQIYYTVDDSEPAIHRRRGLEASAGNFRRIYSADGIVLGPGRTQYFGFSEDLPAEDAKLGDSSFSTDLQNAIVTSAFREFTQDTALGSPTVDMRVEFPWLGPFLALGVESSTPAGRDHIAQVFFSPFAYDHYTNESGQSTEGNTGGSGRPSKTISRESVPVSSGRMSQQSEAYYSFRLRTTREANNSAIRPLIDGNLRATWNNPRWDFNMDLPLLATFSPANAMQNDQFPDYLIEGSQGFGFWGNGSAERVILFDVPREPLVSIGQLQHAAAGRFSYEPAYIVGNAYANIRLPLDDWSVVATDTYMPSNAVWRIGGSFRLFDASYLVNEALFDGYTFTTIPQAASAGDLEGYMSRNRLLPNPRYLPHAPKGLAFGQDTLQDSASGRHNAGFVLSDGAFNINSTSVAAWEAFLSGTKGLPFRRMNADGSVTGFDPVDGVRFPRVQTILGEPWENSPDSNYWIGFRSLRAAEVRELAEAIVAEILERGPFLTLSAFINRRLEDSEAGKSGVLQAALDATVNAGLTGTYEAGADNLGFSQIAEDSTQGAGFPGQLLQGDLLQALAPYMQSRSDTFRIRTYGETLHPVTGRSEGRVWCEAVVQRLPDPVEYDTPDTPLAELAQPGSPFGRQFKVISIRWLSEDEV